MIISHSQKPKLLTFANDVSFFKSISQTYAISYSKAKTKRERGFLSIAGTLLPCFLFLSAAMEQEVNRMDLYSLIEEKKKKDYSGQLITIVAHLKTEKCLEIYGGGFSWSAMLDMESKLIEGNVCAVQVHEYKDFSHGRFMFSLKNGNPKIIFQVESSPYIDKLIEVLSSSNETVPLLVIKSKNKNLIGSIELLIEVQYLIRKLTAILYSNQNIDITKPKAIPSKGLELYHYKFQSQQ